MWWIPGLPVFGAGLALGVGLGAAVGDGLGVGTGVGFVEGVGLGVGLGTGVGVGGFSDGAGEGVALGDAEGRGVGVGCWTTGLPVTDGNWMGVPRMGCTGFAGAAAGRSSAGPEHDRTHASDGMKARRRSLMLSPP
jgi:hypothetical protein